MATNTNELSDTDRRIRVQCSCGERLTTLPQYAGKWLKCSACGKAIVVPASGSSLTRRTSPLVEGEAAGTGMNTLILMWSLVGVFVLASVLFLVWHSHSSHQAKVITANNRISEATASANEWLSGNSLLDGEAVEEQLADSLKNDDATRRVYGEATLVQVRERREQIFKQAEVAVIFEDAKKQIDGKNIEKAIELLRKCTVDPHSAVKVDAQQLLAEVEIAMSDALTVDTLVTMTDEGFDRVKTIGEIRDGKVTHPVLAAARNETVKRNLEKAIQRREETRIAQKKHREEERLAQLKRQQEEEERLKVEQAQLARLASASLLDITDDPDKYVGLTYTFVVWINGRSVKREKETNNEDKVVVDGYVLEMAPGERNPNKSDNIGNRFGVQPDELNPFISSKEVARALQDILDPTSYRKFRVTFTVKAVVLNEWKPLGKRSVGYLAEISNIELP